MNPVLKARQRDTLYPWKRKFLSPIRNNQSTLIVPGIHLGLGGYLRIWLGGERAYLEEGLRRIAKELS